MIENFTAQEENLDDITLSKLAAINFEAFYYFCKKKRHFSLQPIYNVILKGNQ